MSGFEGRMDAWLETSIRGLARRLGRRTFLARLGRVVVGGAVLPLLPIARAGAQSTASPVPTLDEGLSGAQADPQSCEYWRHCAIDGFLCACCGGTSTSCPPGSEVAPITWVGTCRHPGNGKHYLISYNDCCGVGACGRCGCNRNEGERPEYHWYRNNDINWCAGTESQRYHCSIAVVVGEADPQPER